MTPAMWVFVAAVGFSFYTLALYPLLLVLLARRRGRPARKLFTPRSVTVILPVRNGAPWIAAKLESLLALDYPQDLIDIVVISDESEDGTDEIVAAYSTRGPIRLLRVPHGGKAAALNAGIRNSNAEILFFTDVRQELDGAALRRLISCFADPEVGAVSGELVIREGATRDARDVGLYWKYEKWIRKHLSLLDSFHGATGCIYAMRRELALPLPLDTLNDDMYLPLAGVFFRGLRIVFEEGARAYDYPTVIETEFRRKVRTLAGVFQIVALLPDLIGPRNRMWIHFVSHKVARLLIPYALLAAALTSVCLPRPLAIPVAGAQALFYGSAALNRWIPERNGWKRLSSPAAAFCALMAASLCAAVILFVPARRLWSPTAIVAAKDAA